MEIKISAKAEKHLVEWKASGNTVVLKRIRELLESIKETPFEGIGKPEGLKHNLAGKWSRRITLEDRLVYEIIDDSILVHSLKGHY